jgi:hypothetical protein
MTLTRVASVALALLLLGAPMAVARTDEDVQAPRAEAVQAPRGPDAQAARDDGGQDIQAPRDEDVQAPRG